MSVARHVIRLLAVTIVMIVAGLGVSAAQAHDGHTHRHGARVGAEAPVAAVAAKASAASLQADEAGARDACGLCCPACTACCHSVLMPAVATDLPSPSRPARLAASEASMPPGLPPEALPRPPRSIA